METTIWMSYVAVAVLGWYPTYEWLIGRAPPRDGVDQALARVCAALIAFAWPLIVPVWGAWHLSRLTWQYLKRRLGRGDG